MTTVILVHRSLGLAVALSRARARPGSGRCPAPEHRPPGRSAGSSWGQVGSEAPGASRMPAAWLSEHPSEGVTPTATPASAPLGAQLY